MTLRERFSFWAQTGQSKLYEWSGVYTGEPGADFVNGACAGAKAGMDISSCMVGHVLGGLIRTGAWLIGKAERLTPALHKLPAGRAETGLIQAPELPEHTPE